MSKRKAEVSTYSLHDGSVTVQFEWHGDRPMLGWFTDLGGDNYNVTITLEDRENVALLIEQLTHHMGRMGPQNE